jgi:hypothetical protein
MKTSAMIVACGLVAFGVLIGCTRMVRSGPIVSGYENAECIPVEFGPGITPPTRSWDYRLVTPSGITVLISGAQMPGGRIDLRYQSDGANVVAANAGDYIYPADVRFDRQTERLYVKASGVPAAFGGPQTWLFDFDLARRQQMDRVRVDPTVLPGECKVD